MEKVRIEFPNPSRKSRVKCPHCGAENEFSDVDLKQVDASVVRKADTDTTGRQ